MAARQLVRRSHWLHLKRMLPVKSQSIELKTPLWLNDDDGEAVECRPLLFDFMLVEEDIGVATLNA